MAGYGSRLKRPIQLALLSLVVMTFLAADQDGRFQNLGHKLMCMCSCNQVLLECNHVGCPVSPVMRDDLTANIGRGDSDELTLQSFEQKYGPTALLAPTTRGFDRTAWIVPYVALFLGLTTVVLVVRAWKNRPQTRTAGMVAPVSGEETGTLSRAGSQGYRTMTLALLACMLVTAATLVYVFYLPGELHLGPEKTRLAFLRERKDAVYENLRDLNFEFNAGKFPENDYQTMKNSLEEEAAAILAEMAHLEDATSAMPMNRRSREGEPKGESVVEILSSDSHTRNVCGRAFSASLTGTVSNGTTTGKSPPAMT